MCFFHNQVFVFAYSFFLSTSRHFTHFCFLMLQKIGEKGHVKPANYLDSNEKLLIGIATRGGTI